MSMMSEFREFIAKGNVMDLAVGVIIGAAFQKIVDALVNDIIMPVVGLAMGGTDFTNMFTVLRDGAKAAGPYASLAEAKAAGATVIAYGAFVNEIIQFLILAWVVFMIVKAVNRLKAEPPPPPNTKDCPYCLTAIAVGATRCSACTSQLPEGAPAG